MGLETQRQWNELATALTTQALLGLFSMVRLWAGQWAQEDTLPVGQAVWYRKPQPTFADSIALVRQQVWRLDPFSHAAYDSRYGANPTHIAGMLDRYSLLRRVNGQSRG